MTLKQLEAFYLAATLGSFSLAAQRAHVTQSSLSKRIAELEAFLDAELFDRSSKRAIVSNKPGAAGEIANAALAPAQPDGYTIGIALRALADTCPATESKPC